MTKQAFQSFAKSTEDGTVIVVSEDDLYDDDHPYVRAWPDMFGEHLEIANVIGAPVRRGVEQATARPGEKRNVEKPQQ